jgi:SAM-dependent methyltransferase
VGLPPEQDAYGQILLACLEGRGGQEIMERDDGLIYCGDPSDYFAPYRRWPSVEKKAMRYVRGRVLDVGCGAGRVALHLQGRGQEVVAIDNSPLAVEVARRRGVKNALVLSVLDLDPSHGVFDTILFARNNFGLVGGEREARRLLRRLHGLTAEDGRIVTDSVDPERHEDPAFREYGKQAQRYRVRWREFATPWFRYLMFSPADFEHLIEGTGWRVRRFLEDEEPRYVAILEKEPVGGRSDSSLRLSGLAAEVRERAHGFVNEGVRMYERRELVRAWAQRLDPEARDGIDLAVHDEVRAALDHPERDDLAPVHARRADCELALSFCTENWKLGGFAHSAAFSAACATVSRSA